MNIAAILIIGAIGGAIRYALVPLGASGTLVVNLAASLLAGFAVVYLARKCSITWLRQGILVGFIPSLSTFSTFSADAAHLMATRPVPALLYIGLSLAASLCLCMAGTAAAERLLGTLPEKRHATAVVLRQQEPAGRDIA